MQLEDVKRQFDNLIPRQAGRMALVISGMYAAGRKKEAQALWPEVMARLERIQEPKRRMDTLDRLFAGAVATEEAEKALRFEAEVLVISRAETRSYSEHAARVGRLIRGLIDVKQPTRARWLAKTELAEQLPRLQNTANFFPTIRVLALSLWLLGDSPGYLSLLDQYWPRASDAEELLRLLPLACAVALRDEKQRAEIVNSLVPPNAGHGISR